MQPAPNWFRNAAVLLAVSALILTISSGLRQSMGLFLPPMAKEGMSASVFSFGVALLSIVWGISQPFIGMLADKYGTRPVLVATSIIYAAGLAIMAQVGGAFGLNLGAGLLAGIGVAGTGLGILMGTVSRAVPPEKRSQAVGTVAALGSLGTLVLAPLGQQMIDGLGWRGAALGYAAIAASMAAVAFAIRSEPSATGTTCRGGIACAPILRPTPHGKGVPMLTLYLAPGSSSMAPHIALHEIGVPFEIEALSFKTQELSGPAYRAINPEGKVPTLLIDGRRLTEVAGILYYLARRHPEAKLFPAGDVEAEAQVVSWMSFIAASVHPARRQGLEYARTIYALADQRLGKGPWAVGDYSIADIHLFRLFWRFFNSLHPAPNEFPHLHAHYTRMMARPAVRKTIEVESAIGYELP